MYKRQQFTWTQRPQVSAIFCYWQLYIFAIKGNNIFAIHIIYASIEMCIRDRRNVFQDFTDGVPSGLKTGLAICPAITAMMLAVNMFTKSGLCDYFTKLITPVVTNIGIPAELIPLITLTPLSGSGSLRTVSYTHLDVYKRQLIWVLSLEQQRRFSRQMK